MDRHPPGGGWRSVVPLEHAETGRSHRKSDSDSRAFGFMFGGRIRREIFRISVWAVWRYHCVDSVLILAVLRMKCMMGYCG